MTQTHILTAPPHRRVHWLVPLVVAVAATLVVLALVLAGNDDPAPPTAAGDVSASPATAARPDESGIAAAIAQPSQSMPYQARPDESRVAAAIAQPSGSMPYRARPDESKVAASIAAGYQDKPSLSQIKRDAEFNGR
jgi:hypothetical protein